MVLLPVALMWLLTAFLILNYSWVSGISLFFVIYFLKAAIRASKKLGGFVPVLMGLPCGHLYVCPTVPAHAAKGLGQTYTHAPVYTPSLSSLGHHAFGGFAPKVWSEGGQRPRPTIPLDSHS